MDKFKSYPVRSFQEIKNFFDAIHVQVDFSAIPTEIPALSPLENSMTKKWNSKRVNEFMAGRLCAKKSLGIKKYDQFALIADADGLPKWPEGKVGSISHTSDLACAISSDRYRALGVDVERVSRETSPRIIDHLLSKEELKLHEHWLNSADEHRLLLFSMKEALYKAFYSLFKKGYYFKKLPLHISHKEGVYHYKGEDRQAISGKGYFFLTVEHMFSFYCMD